MAAELAATSRRAPLASRRPFITQGNLHFVPVLRQRLAFAVLVRRALSELDTENAWSPSEDLIAVVLPPSVRPTLLQAIKDLPRVSLILAEVPSAGLREVFPVTPCDAMIEATRVAEERRLSIEFVDLEVAPGNLLRGPCLRNSQWPDDTFVDVLGPDRYLSMIDAYFSSPPARIEPLDTWRESAIADRLRSLQPRWRRILVVCEAGLTRPVMRRLCSPTLNAKPPVFDATRITFSVVQQLRLEILLGYLDDYPALVERYEHERAWDDVGTFDKWDALRQAILAFVEANRDIVLSTRQHQIFHTFLNNLLVLQHRRCPQPDVLHGAAASCFGTPFAERLNCYLASYGRQVRVERVAPKSTASSGTMQWTVEVDSSRHGFVGRSCNPEAPSYEVRPRIRTGTDTNPNSSEILWPPEATFQLKMYRKLQHVSARIQSRQRNMPYAGSVEMGIDVRRTLRASASGRISLVVKAFSRRRDSANLTNEPVVWVLLEDWDRRVTTGSNNVTRRTDGRIKGRNENSYHVGSMDVIAIDFERDRGDRLLFEGENGDGRVNYYDRVGWIAFVCDFEDGEQQARLSLGDDFDLRSPNHADFGHPRHGRIDGCVHNDLVEMARDGASWLEIGLLTAARYAKNTVIFVAPPGVHVPDSVVRHPLARGKAFMCVPLSEFSREERGKLAVHYRYSTAEARNSEADTAFALIMRRFW